ncbi:hypothetical protein Btru_045168 [Bulinus truncatus]|nr:hypothetical protein Btru_045168 [Bulinus truncatus]
MLGEINLPKHPKLKMPISLAVKVITRALCIVIDVIVLFLNPLIIDVIHNDRAIRRLPSAVFITNLAIADMFVAGTNLMNMLFNFMDLSRVFPICIILYGFFSLSMINASLLFMFCNSIDRFVFIKMSFHYHAVMSRTCVRGVVIAVWVTSVSLPFFPYIFIDHAWEYSACMELFHSLVYRVFHFILAAVFALTIVATAVMFFGVFRVVRRSRRLRTLPTRTFSSATTMSPGSTWLSLNNSPDSPISELMPYKHAQLRKLLKSVSGDEESCSEKSLEPANECSENVRCNEDTDESAASPITEVPNFTLDHQRTDCNSQTSVEDAYTNKIIDAGTKRPPTAVCEILGRSLQIKSSPDKTSNSDEKNYKRGHFSGDEGVELNRHGTPTKKSPLRKTKSETHIEIRANKKKRSCARKALDHTNQLTHFWCAKPTLTYDPDLLPDSIFIFKQRAIRQLQINSDCRTEASFSSASLSSHEKPRIDCVEHDGKYSIVIQSSALFSEINRSIAACYEGSSVSYLPGQTESIDASVKESQLECSAAFPGAVTQHSVPKTGSTTAYRRVVIQHSPVPTSHNEDTRDLGLSSVQNASVLRPTHISLENRPHEIDKTEPSNTETPESSKRQPRFSFLTTSSALGKKLSLLSQSTPTSTPATPFGVPTYSGRDIRTLKILFVMFCVYLLLWSPTFLVNVLRSLDIEVSLEVVVVCYTFGVSNSVVNFFVYPMKIPRLKLVFKQIFHKSFSGVKTQTKRMFVFLYTGIRKRFHKA